MDNSPTTSPSPVVKNGTDPCNTKPMNLVAENAKRATAEEHRMTLLQGIRLYPKASACIPRPLLGAC
jgi:hypothetical protein